MRSLWTAYMCPTWPQLPASLSGKAHHTAWSICCEWSLRLWRCVYIFAGPSILCDEIPGSIPGAGLSEILFSSFATTSLHIAFSLISWGVKSPCLDDTFVKAGITLIFSPAGLQKPATVTIRLMLELSLSAPEQLCPTLHITYTEVLTIMLACCQII